MTESYTVEGVENSAQRMCIHSGLSEGLGSNWIPHVLEVGLDPGSDQDSKILPITEVKKKIPSAGEKKSQMPGIPRTVCD